MLKQIAAPRAEISKYAPSIINTTIKVDKIRDVIGPGGKMINKIIAETGVKIDIEEDGSVYIYSDNTASAIDAQGMIEDIVREFEVGGIYTGRHSQKTGCRRQGVYGYPAEDASESSFCGNRTGTDGNRVSDHHQRLWTQGGDEPVRCGRHGGFRQHLSADPEPLLPGNRTR